MKAVETSLPPNHNKGTCDTEQWRTDLTEAPHGRGAPFKFLKIHRLQNTNSHTEKLKAFGLWTWIG